MSSAMAMAHNGEDHSTETSAKPMMNHESMDHASMNHATYEQDVSVQTESTVTTIDHSQTKSSSMNHSTHQGHDHRKEHGAQIYAVTTVDNKWQINDDGEGRFKSEFESKIGTDEHKVFIKMNVDKLESQDAEYDAKVLYSHMISDFWDAQIGGRYRNEVIEFESGGDDTEEKVDAVIGLHGLAPYFFETEAYLYVGEDSYTAFSLETERDLLITQQLIAQPYLDLEIIFNDNSKYAEKSGLNNITVGIETRYEVTKKIMPYLNIAYEYAKGDDETAWQKESDSEKGWLYGAGIRFKF